MKIWQLQTVGTDIPLVENEIEIPKIARHELLIKTHSISINPVDLKTRKGGGVFKAIEGQEPKILGWDIAGEVVKVGSEVKHFQIGDSVFGMVNFPGHGKVYAEYVAAPAEHLARKPSNITYEEAAASTLAALTALQTLSRFVKEGQKVLVHAAAGGVGHFAIQIAKILGAQVSGTASDRNKTFLADLGLEEFIDYKKQNLLDLGKQFDFILDPIGGETQSQSIDIAKPGGQIISISQKPTEALLETAEEAGVNIEFQLVQSSGKDMNTIANWLEEKKLIPHISKVYPIDQINAAHEELALGHTRGKIILNF
ncbi:NADP-dependent oxidoreductase [Marinilongibacter aquaticus]|uniref:NADP-dependent oxidoreductase n=1 Tax=Marinilongibacter aquaticus TaxID=2975157 RepID=UPI0021BDA6C9|nr:NADP-dependent oxidoreductase [Marinilongibacter aquaticus]UBM57377.1 NADP-dependent oxidoreductase [Marinilongibacter aquaticus]